MSKAIGIDLGTTNSVMAWMHGNRPEVIDNQESDSKTPSIVYFSETDAPVVGKLAAQKGGRESLSTVHSIKRFIGRNFRTPEVEYDRQRVTYNIVESPDGGVEVDIRGRRYSPQEISAFILESLKHDAEAFFDEEVSQAVITVPAYFGTRMRDATHQAGQLAGLEVLKIIPEPVAAALAYGFGGNYDDPNMMLVYDFSGSTLNVTVLLLAAGMLADLGKTGDMHLGGCDFDNLIMDWIAKQIHRRYQIDVRDLPWMHRHQIEYSLRLAAEQAKIHLSFAPQAIILAPALLRDKNNHLVDVELELSRGDFNQMIQPYVNKSLQLVDDAIRQARINEQDITAVLMTGGSTRVPLVEEALRSRFGGRVVRGEVNPSECVAEGAALQTLLVDSDTTAVSDLKMRQCTICGARNMLNRSHCRSCRKPLSMAFAVTPIKRKDPHNCPHCGKTYETGTEICNHCGKTLHAPGNIFLSRIHAPIGIQLAGDMMYVIFDTDKYYPTEEPVSITLHTASPNQRMASLPVFEGWDREYASNNTLIGYAQVELPPELSANTAVCISFDLDNDGILRVRAALQDHPDIKFAASMQWITGIEQGGEQKNS